MATLSVVNSAYGHATITYSVSSTNDTTTVTVSKLEYICYTGSSDLLAVSVTCDGTSLYSSHMLPDGSLHTLTLNRTKSFSRGTGAASKTLRLTAFLTGKSATITVPALPSYTVTFNANGGSGAPSSQTKYYGKTLTLSTTKPTLSGATFMGWATSTANAARGTVAYAAGASYTANAAATLYAVWRYTIAYNANGGSGAPSTQYKYRGQTVTLSTTRPTRTDFAFVSWNTNSAGSGTSYGSGGSYSANAAATLYAQWRRTYSDPVVSVSSVQRVDATTHDADDMGRSVAVTLTWSVFDTPSGTNHPVSVVVECNGASVTLTTLTGLTGTATAYVDADCDPDYQYPVNVTLTDEGGASRSATAEGVVTTPYYPLDIRQGGKGVAIGGPSTEDAFDVFMPTKILPRSTSATETPLTINDGTDDVFAVDWDGTVTHGGDVPWTNLPLTSSVTAFSDGQVPMYRKWGPVVTLCGAVKMTSAQSADFTVQIGQLPVGCRPSRTLDVLCQGSNREVWLLDINESGVVRASRYRKGDTLVAVTTSTWFPFTATFLVA